MLLLSFAVGPACQLAPPGGVAQATNPVFIPVGHTEAVWERAVDVLHDYHFLVVRENKLDGTIETEYRVGSGVLEPWHHDSIGTENRLESTLQSIRRRMIVTVTPAEGGHWVSVEALKELEDLPGLAANSPGAATFQESQPLQRNLDVVVGQTAPSGWILLGRDLPLEQDYLRRLQGSF
ncbi:MAG TPA: hypothetical protein VML55_00415 [Planctomycetaceae bacterium]|nr:hypothetical protein [Planctomycetaceae bacterium]